MRPIVLAPGPLLDHFRIDHAPVSDLPKDLVEAPPSISLVNPLGVQDHRRMRTSDLHRPLPTASHIPPSAFRRWIAKVVKVVSVTTACSRAMPSGIECRSPNRIAQARWRMRGSDWNGRSRRLRASERPSLRPSIQQHPRRRQVASAQDLRRRKVSKTRPRNPRCKPKHQDDLIHKAVLAPVTPTADYFRPTVAASDRRKIRHRPPAAWASVRAIR